MAKQKRKLIEKLLFEVYDKGLQMEDCNLTAYYEKILQALNIPFVSKSVCPKCGNTGRCEPRTLSDPDGQECDCGANCC
jgi:hypothetical protein